MKLIPASWRWRGAGPQCLAALCLPVLAACPDGYPSGDVPQVDPARMTQEQLLAALNDLGNESQMGKRWRFGLRAGCELEITVHDGKRERRHVVLEGAAVATRSSDGITEIRLVPQAGGEAQAVTALETRRWPDTVRARALLTQLELRCGRPAAPPA